MASLALMFVEMLLAVLTVGAVFLRGLWPFEAAAGALTQLFVVCLCASFLSFGLARPVSGAMLVAAAALGLWRAQETFATPSPPINDPEITVVWANIYDRTRSSLAVQRLALAENADFVALGEYPLTDNLLPEFRVAYPHRAPERSTARQNSVVFSRTPFLAVEELQSKRHPPIKVRVETRLGPLTLIAVHPPVPFTPGLLRRQREETARAFAALPPEEPGVLIGDFNAVPWNLSLSQPSTTPNAPLRLSLGPRATWMSPVPMIGAQIDHAFISRGLEGSVRLGPANGSDHLPIVVRVRRKGLPLAGREDAARDGAGHAVGGG